jgi:5-amino-6-(5-phosphoribosylamino)uracil reductase
VPAIAVVTARCSLEPTDPIVTDTVVPTIVFTTATAPAHRRDALTAAGADVVACGDTAVDLAAVLDELFGRGLPRISCEGGPRLFAGLIAADLVDQLCLTVTPLLTAGDAGRIAHGPLPEAPRDLALASVLHEDGFLMLRYGRARAS